MKPAMRCKRGRRVRRHMIAAQKSRAVREVLRDVAVATTPPTIWDWLQEHASRVRKIIEENTLEREYRDVLFPTLTYRQKEKP